MMKDGIIQTANGDLQIGNSKEQLLGNIMNSDPGAFRKWPTIGPSLIRKIDGPFDSRSVAANIQDNATLDGWEIREIDLSLNGDELETTIISADKVTDNTSSLI